MTDRCYYCAGPWEEVVHGPCDACAAARDAHPAWQAIQRVECGEATVRRRGDLGGVYWYGFYWLETSDGWRVNVYSRGVPFSDWRYIEAMIAPDGTRYEADCGDGIKPGSLPLPQIIWDAWCPSSRAERKRWALLSEGWFTGKGADARIARVEQGGDPCASYTSRPPARPAR